MMGTLYYEKKKKKYIYIINVYGDQAALKLTEIYLPLPPEC